MPPEHKEILELLKVEWFIDHGGPTRTEMAQVSEVSSGGGGFSSAEVERLVPKGRRDSQQLSKDTDCHFRS